MADLKQLGSPQGMEGFVNPSGDYASPQQALEQGGLSGLVGHAAKLYQQITQPIQQASPGAGGLVQGEDFNPLNMIPKSKGELAWQAAMLAAPMVLGVGANLMKATKQVPGMNPNQLQKLESSALSGRWSDRPNQFSLAKFGEMYYPESTNVENFEAWPRYLQQPLVTALGKSNEIPITPTFQSNLLQALDDPKLKVPEKMNRAQAQSLAKLPGIKAEEFQFTPGLQEFLGSKDKFTKSEIRDFVRDAQVQVQEINNPKVKPEYARNDFSSLSLPGGENYREFGLQWANQPASMKPNYSYVKTPDGRFQIRNQVGENVGDSFYTEPQAQQAVQRWSTNWSPEAQQFTGGHYSDPNILAHIRTTDRMTPDGKKILFLEEVQSDWQKRLRDADKAQADPTTTWNYQASKILHDKGIGEHAPLTKQQVDNPDSLRGGMEATRAANVPDAPLARNYHELALKRMMRIAADEGYDGIGWTTGDQQAKRYKNILEEGIDTVHYDTGSGNLRALKDGQEVINTTVPTSQLGEKLGAENARKLLETTQVVQGPQVPKTWNDYMKDNSSTRSKGRAMLISGTNPEGQQIWAWENPAANADTIPYNGGEIYNSYQSAVESAPKGKFYINEAYEPIEHLNGYIQRKTGTASLQAPNMTVGERGFQDVYDKALPKVAEKLGKEGGVRHEMGQIGTTSETTWEKPAGIPDLHYEARINTLAAQPNFSALSQAARSVQSVLRNNPHMGIEGVLQWQNSPELYQALNWKKNTIGGTHDVHLLHLPPQLRQSISSRPFSTYAPPIGAAAIGAEAYRRYLQQKQSQEIQ